MSLTAHLWAAGKAPRIYSIYKLCEKFGWTPEQARGLSVADYVGLLTCMGVENKVAARRAESAPRRKR